MHSEVPRYQAFTVGGECDVPLITYYSTPEVIYTKEFFFFYISISRQKRYRKLYSVS